LSHTPQRVGIDGSAITTSATRRPRVCPCIGLRRITRSAVSRGFALSRRGAGRIRGRHIVVWCASARSTAASATHRVTRHAADERFDSFRRGLPRRSGFLASQVRVRHLDEDVETTLGVIAADDTSEGARDLKRLHGGQTLPADSLLSQGQQSRPAGGVLRLHTGGPRQQQGNCQGNPRR